MTQPEMYVLHTKKLTKESDSVTAKFIVYEM